MKPHELAANLAQLAKEIAQPQALLEAMGEAIEANVKPHVPVRTGVLQGSISWRIAESRYLFVGSAVDYAPFVDARVGFLQSGLDDSTAEIDRLTAEWGDDILRKVGE
jgi:hypothetical protein